MARPFMFAFVVVVSILGQESANDKHNSNASNQKESCFPACPTLQCTGIYGPRVGPQERWTEVAEWVKKKAPESVIDERIVLSPGKWGDQVTATADMINKGEVLLRLPLEMFLLEEDCFPSESFKQLGSKYVSSLSKLPLQTWNGSKAHDFTQAGLCLLVHRLLGKDSPYEGYIKHLPLQSSSETYMFRKFSDFESFKGTDAYRIGSVIKQRHHALLDQAAGPALRMLQDYFPLNWTEDKIKFELQQTLSLCGSRTFNLDSDMLSPGNKSSAKLYRPALVPLLDMLNHGDGRTRNCQYYYNTEYQQFHLVATKDIEAGEELIHSYGSRSNTELLFFYGFMMPGNTEDFVSVADMTAGAIDLNYHITLGRDARCFTPYFRPVEGSQWPPSFSTTIQNASADENASSIQLGPLYPSVFRSFKRKLEQQPRPANIVNVFSYLAQHSGALLKIVDGEFAVSQRDGGKPQHSEAATRGNLTVELAWRGSPRPEWCEPVARPKCEEFAPGLSSVSAIVARLKQGLLPALARVGGCRVWSERKQHMYEIKPSTDGTWAAVATEDHAGKVEQSPVHQADVLREFQFKRYLIRAAGLEQFNSKVFRNGLLPETLASIRIAVLPELSSFAIHSILTGNRFPPELEQQVARTLGMFCFEESTRRLQALGIDTDTESLSALLGQARLLLLTEATGNYERLARNELDILKDFCSGISDWGVALWQ